MMRPTIKNVAAEAGVSTATVSYVLAGRTKGKGSGISIETSRRVHEAAHKLGYRPNQAARTIRTGRSNLMMLSLTMLSDPWSLSVSKAVGAAVSAEGITPMILADTDWRKAIPRQGADVIFIDDAAQAGDAELLAELSRSNSLVVFSETLEPNGFDVIRSMAGPSLDLAMDHLTARHRRIAVLTTKSSLGAKSPARLEAYRDGMKRAGLPELVAAFDGDELNAYAAAVELLSRPDPPTAIFAISDYAAIAAIHAAQRLRLSVPDDLEVIGVGNTTQGEVMTPSLSSVGPVGFFTRLADVLVERALNPHAPHRAVDFPWQVLLRDSSPEFSQDLQDPKREVKK
ncbi:LacI family transcriptional regulator [Arthrobacter stackebrandtii]|uniref:LacI family transcriptional regulator n=1 Tax=Arthrobacter stackebrandtii TaxID=272161 RepID=A0ABS4YRK2_9MICC|nr:LacI family DNA-binding transcriptional regulator [Arthrobacter stackebrandtii]MBP2411415.1 LacI family transcriptional regulator [Arthrobacter stackebrandtii]PYH00299.1 LacI family transcriptional regulator [Arthrobacter stackebrandtii]